MLWPRALFLLLVFLLPAHAGGEAPCPLGDSGRLIRVERSWNLGGGVDSDGCAYGVDAKGRRRILGLEVVAECPRCGGVFLTRPLAKGALPAPGAVSPQLQAEVKALGDTFRRERQLGPRLDQGARLELAARIYLALGQRLGLDEGARRALAGRLYLRAAWAARGRAVLQGPDAGFRPRNLGEVEAQLRSLEERHDADPAAEPTVRALDRSLADVNRARRALTRRLQGASPAERFAQAEARLGLDRLERELYARKARRLAELEREQPLGRKELGLARIRAWIRAGHASRAKRALAAADDDSSTQAMREAVAEEQRLLGLAASELRAAGEVKGLDDRRAARLLFLAGDATRRRGQEALFRALLNKVRQLAPQDQAGLRAARLLGS
jgi:hypothetical protein